MGGSYQPLNTLVPHRTVEPLFFIRNKLMHPDLEPLAPRTCTSILAPPFVTTLSGSFTLQPPTWTSSTSHSAQDTTRQSQIMVIIFWSSQRWMSFKMTNHAIKTQECRSLRNCTFKHTSLSNALFSLFVNHVTPTQNVPQLFTSKLLITFFDNLHSSTLRSSAPSTFTLLGASSSLYFTRIHLEDFSGEPPQSAPLLC